MAERVDGGAIFQRVARLQRGEDGQVLARMASGWAILANQQPEALTGCCMLLPDPVVAALNDLDDAARATFLTDWTRLGDAVLAVTGAERINYLILCNQVPELHGHVVPRFADEDPERRKKGPFEAYDFAASRRADADGRDRELVRRLREWLRPFAKLERETK
ncbi:MAG: hypothetical protein GC161_17425 [Planctomycetaceae bacterium]|nr:hypothetical protein [Planctomycetaceae bacterium]